MCPWEGRYNGLSVDSCHAIDGWKMEFLKISRVKLLEWIREQWKPYIKNISRVLAMVNGWFAFHFLYEEDRQVVEKRY